MSRPAPDTAERAILRAVERLGITEAAAETLFHQLLLDLGGWAQHARWLLWQAELEGRSDQTLIDLLALRLVWDEALLAHAPEVTEAWATVVAGHAAPLMPTPDQVLDAVLQDASERAFQRTLPVALRDASAAGAPARPALQAAFCIDVRSEVFRRALESLDPTIATIGFAGFFGLPVAHHAAASDLTEAHLPVLLKPALHSRAELDAAVEGTERIAARATRAWGRFRQAAVSSFAFVEAAGPFYAGKLVRDALGIAQGKGARSRPGA